MLYALLVVFELASAGFHSVLCIAIPNTTIKYSTVFKVFYQFCWLNKFNFLGALVGTTFVGNEAKVLNFFCLRRRLCWGGALGLAHRACSGYESFGFIGDIDVSAAPIYDMSEYQYR